MSVDSTATTNAPSAPPLASRATWRAVVVPSEHGGWGLTLEPVLLGLLLAPSVAGLAVGAAAFFAFLVRTPLKLMAVDVRRGRRLPRTALALRFVMAEVSLLAALSVISVWRAGLSWLIPIAVAAPLVATELWFDARSRGRRLVPELCGAIGICSVAAAVVLAGDGDAEMAVAAWLILIARAAGSITFVRVQIDRLRHGAGRVRLSDAAQVIAVAVAAVAVFIELDVMLGALGVVALAMLQLLWVRRPPVPAKVIGLRQLTLGFALVAMTAGGALLR